MNVYANNTDDFSIVPEGYDLYSMVHGNGSDQQDQSANSEETQGLSNDILTRMYFFQEMSTELHQICFPEGDFVGNVIFYQPDVSIHETVVDCPAQLAALHDEMMAIDQFMQADPEIICQQAVTSSTADNLVEDIDEVLTMQNMCEEDRSRSMNQCLGEITCAMAKLIGNNVITDTAIDFGCSSAGIDMNRDECRPNAQAGVAYSLSDTLSLFGLDFMGTQPEPTQEQIDAANENARLATVHQSEQSVRSFTSDPAGWAYDAANSILNQMSDSIMNRFGCDEWEGEPYMTSCKKPVSWSCAGCSERKNMVCGTLGYLIGAAGQEILLSTATGGAFAAGRAAGGFIARQSAKIAVKAKSLFPKRSVRHAGIISRSFGRAVRLGTMTAARLKDVWRAMKSSVAVQSISRIAAEVKDRIGQGANAISVWRAAARQKMVYAVTEDALTGIPRAMYAAGKRYNELSEQAFNFGYNATSYAKFSGVTRLRNDPNSPLVNDILNGNITKSDGSNFSSIEDFYEYRVGSHPNRDDFTYAVSTDGRFTIVAKSPGEFENPISVGNITTPNPPQAPDARIADFTFNPSRSPAPTPGQPIIVTGGADLVSEYQENSRAFRRIAGEDVSDDVTDSILDLRRTDPLETAEEFTERREEIIASLQSGLGLSEEAARRKYDELVDAGIVQERNPASNGILASDNLEQTDLSSSNLTLNLTSDADGTLTLTAPRAEAISEAQTLYRSAYDNPLSVTPEMQNSFRISMERSASIGEREFEAIIRNQANRINRRKDIHTQAKQTIMDSLLAGDDKRASRILESLHEYNLIDGFQIGRTLYKISQKIKNGTGIAPEAYDAYKKFRTLAERIETRNSQQNNPDSETPQDENPETQPSA